MKSKRTDDTGNIQDEEFRRILQSVKHVPDRRTEERRNRTIPTGAWVIGLSILAVILLVVGIILIVNALKETDPLVGKWNYDDTTIYEFGEDGRGSLILPLNSYSFSYKDDNGSLFIDFSDDTAEDKTYTYEISDDILLLTGDGTEYRFIRVDSE